NWTGGLGFAFGVITGYGLELGTHPVPILKPYRGYGGSESGWMLLCGIVPYHHQFCRIRERQGAKENGIESRENCAICSDTQSQREDDCSREQWGFDHQPERKFQVSS